MDAKYFCIWLHKNWGKELKIHSRMLIFVIIELGFDWYEYWGGWISNFKIYIPLQCFACYKDTSQFLCNVKKSENQK